jgi:hypothetical protein
MLFRFSLDDNTETMVTTTLLALRNLLFNDPDEVRYKVFEDIKKGRFIHQEL